MDIPWLSDEQAPRLVARMIRWGNDYFQLNLDKFIANKRLLDLIDKLRIDYLKRYISPQAKLNINLSLSSLFLILLLSNSYDYFLIWYSSVVL
jgi:hypothetical protein